MGDLFEVEKINLPNSVGISQNTEMNLTEINKGGVLETKKEQKPVEIEEVTLDNVKKDGERDIKETEPNQENKHMGIIVDRVILPLFDEIETQINSLDPKDLAWIITDLEAKERTQRELEEIRHDTNELRVFVNAYSDKHGDKTAAETPLRPPDKNHPSIHIKMTPAYLKNKYQETSQQVEAHRNRVLDLLKKGEAK